MFDYVTTVEDGVIFVRFRNGPVKWRSDCGLCTMLSIDGLNSFPPHQAQPGCKDFKVKHCTCRSCF